MKQNIKKSIRAKVISWLIQSGLYPYVPGSTRVETLDSMLSMLRPLAIPEGLIRVGGRADGGYLLPDNLDGIAACFSPGVGALAPFELDMAQRGVRSFMADGSVDAPPAAHALFSFERKFLGTVNDARHIRLEDWVQRSVPDDSGDLLLQMDIEGGEYAVLADAPASVLARFRIMVIEFHGLYRCFREKRHKLIGGVFEKLASEFSVVHIHPNNNGAEVSKGGLAVPEDLAPVLVAKLGRRPPRQRPAIARKNMKQNMKKTLWSSRSTEKTASGPAARR